MRVAPIIAAGLLLAAGTARAAENRPPAEARAVWTGPEVNLLGAPSRDGRWLSFVDRSTGNLALRSLSDDRIVPVLGRLTPNPEAYSYLAESVHSFPDPPGLAGKMDAAGFERIRWLLTAGGILAIHSGVARGGE